MNYLLWFDDSKTPMSVKAQKAVKYYQNKFGFPPLIIESSVLDDPLQDGLSVAVKRVRLPKFHFLIGVE